MKHKLHPIGYVSRVTGLSPHLIRAWERRYGAIAPDRSDGNRRLYSDEDIQRLTALNRGVKAGHRIAQLSAMEPHVLNRLTHPVPGNGRVVASSEPPKPVGDHLQACIDAVGTLSVPGLERALSEAAAELPRRQFLENVVAPLMNGIGEKWSEGSLKILNEHMASTVVQAFLWDLLRGSPSGNDRPSLVVATPSGQWCVLGALVVAVLASDLGWHTHFYGPNLPGEEIAGAIRSTGAGTVALSLTCTTEPSLVNRELRRLRQGVPSHVSLLVGGRIVDTIQDVVVGNGGHCVKDLNGLQAVLEDLSESLPAPQP